jgi:hypothetical protein
LVAAEDAPAGSSQRVFTALEQYRASMSSAEARDRLAAALVARLFSEEQLRVLREARIEDDGGASQLVRAIDSLTPQQLEVSIVAMLEANPSWPDEETLAELARVLGPGAGDGDYRPAPPRRLVQAALPPTDDQGWPSVPRRA